MVTTSAKARLNFLPPGPPEASPTLGTKSSPLALRFPVPWAGSLRAIDRQERTKLGGYFRPTVGPKAPLVALFSLGTLWILAGIALRRLFKQRSLPSKCLGCLS